MNIWGERQFVSVSKTCWEIIDEMVVLLFSWNGNYNAAKITGINAFS